MTVDARPVGALHVAVDVVANCADAGLLAPDAQVAVTFQSYNEPELRPVKFAVVAVWAVEKLVQVEDEFSL